MTGPPASLRGSWAAHDHDLPLDDLYTPEVCSIARDAVTPILRRRGVHYQLSAADYAELWEDAIAAVLDYLDASGGP